MLIVSNTTNQFIDDLPFDIVERKGRGHPDSLADGLAEAISREYSLYCLKEFGHILHHNTDKTALLGGSAHVTFGNGHLTQPIIALVNGRLTPSLGAQQIPVEDLVTMTTQQYLQSILPLLDVEHDVQVRTRISQASSPGQVYHEKNEKAGSRQFWFAPRSLSDLQELQKLFANDTSCGVGYAPLSISEQVVLGIEQYLNSQTFKISHPEYGSDIKIMLCRYEHNLHITACVPLIARHIPNLQTYIELKEAVQALIKQLAENIAPDYHAQVSVNTRDNHKTCELYLTAIGSAIESGDEGVVGRGNRSRGTISVLRPMSVEGICGKNPVYHVGKLYNILANKAAEQIYQTTNRPTVVCLISQSGRDLVDPWIAAIEQTGSAKVDSLYAESVIINVMQSIESIRQSLLSNELTLF